MNIKKTTQQALIVDDEAVIRNGISRALRGIGIRTKSVESGRQALDLMRERHFDFVLLDIRMPDIDGVTLLKQIRSRYPETNVIMITGYPTIDSAVDCIKLGAIDYLVKPFQLNDLEASIEKILPIKHNPPGSPVRSNGLEIDSEKGLIIGQSRPMKNIFKKTLRVAPTDSTVLITGESGTGKELIARAIHSHSSRKDNEFVAVDCSSLVETLLESELFGHVKGSFNSPITAHSFLMKSRILL